MSDIVISAIISAIGLIIVSLINTSQNKKIVSKVEEYHKEVNGKMGELLTTTKALGNAEGKAEEKADKRKKQ